MAKCGNLRNGNLITMENVINIAKLLKDCPKGMKLYSPLCGECEFDRLNWGTIICKKQNTQEITFTSEGYYMLPIFDDCECVLFPSKENRDWSKFVPPCKFKDGDVVVVGDDKGKTNKVMEQKINIAELLKDCPKGMELDCTMYDNVKLKYVDERNDICYPIKVTLEDGSTISFTEYGQYSLTESAKCVIFPKGKTTWEGFHRPFKDGDIVAGENHNCKYITIFRKFINDDSFNHYVCLTSFGKFVVGDISDNANLRFATKEEKQKLFDAIKDNGYHWNTKTKTLEKLPKFKVGDRIKKKGVDDIYAIEIEEVTQTIYTIKNHGGFLYVGTTDKEYELAPNKFDITTLKPFDKVLVRNSDLDLWSCAFYSHYEYEEIYAYKVCTNIGYQQCIPYKGNEHLLNTTNDCDEYYITWL